MTVGSRGRVWIDRETNRVLRFEQIATEIPGDFPITAASTLIDYDWVTINENKYLLPTHSEILLTTYEPQPVDSEPQRNSLSWLSEVWRGVEGDRGNRRKGFSAGGET